jgi:NADH dehydrogenase FAD-containing subunit
VKGIDYEKRQVKLEGRDNLPFDKLLIASGCVNKFPPIIGLDSVNFSSLRTIKDYEEINKAVR